MSRIKATIEYDGTNFSGMQLQQHSPTIQGEIEKALNIILRKQTTISFAGRTDAGVHALGQVISFDVDGNVDENICGRIQSGLNFFLPQVGISCINIEKTDDDFDPRRWAVERSYVYKICNRRAPTVIDLKRKWHVPYSLDIKKMRLASAYFIGKHNFTSLRSKECTAPNPVRSINSIVITQNNSDIEIIIFARSFLHKMVRNIVGTLVEIGKNAALSPDIVKQIIEKQDRSAAFVTAPPDGLYFKEVKY